MRVVVGFLIALVVALGVAACDVLWPATTVEPSPGTSTPNASLPVPGSSGRPGRPSPSIEIPPPID